MPSNDRLPWLLLAISRSLETMIRLYQSFADKGLAEHSQSASINTELVH